MSNSGLILSIKWSGKTNSNARWENTSWNCMLGGCVDGDWCSLKNVHHMLYLGASCEIAASRPYLPSIQHRMCIWHIQGTTLEAMLDPYGSILIARGSWLHLASIYYGWKVTDYQRDGQVMLDWTRQLIWVLSLPARLDMNQLQTSPHLKLWISASGVNTYTCNLKQSLREWWNDLVQDTCHLERRQPWCGKAQIFISIRSYNIKDKLRWFSVHVQSLANHCPAIRTWKFSIYFIYAYMYGHSP